MTWAQGPSGPWAAGPSGPMGRGPSGPWAQWAHGPGPRGADDGDGGGGDGGRISSNLQPPLPIAPRDKISRPGKPLTPITSEISKCSTQHHVDVFYTIHKIYNL